MLQSLSKSSRGFIARVLLFGILILSFALWGVGDFIRQGANPDEVALIGETRISPALLQQRMREASRRFGDAQGALLQDIGFAGLVLDGLVEQALAENESNALEILPPDEVLRRHIASSGAFADLQGNFSPERYRLWLADSGLSEEEFAQTLRRTASEPIGCSSLWKKFCSLPMLWSSD